MIGISTGRTRRLAALVGGMSLAATSALALTAGTDAAARVTADLSVTQAISGSSTSGTTVDTVSIKNPSGSSVSTVILNQFLTTTSTSNILSVPSAPSGTHCTTTPAPSGITVVATCVIPSIAANSTATVKINASGTVGAPFTMLVAIGAAGLSDSNVANNKSTVSSWYGPRAELVSTSSVVAGTTAGTVTVKENAKNNGPNTANALQMVIEIKSAGFSSVIATGNVSGGSCQFIPPATGYNAAVSCVISSLATGKTWTESLAFKGTKGTSLQVDTSVSANNPADPVPTNNKNSRTTTYHA